MDCERCARGDVRLVITISDIVDELPDGALQCSNHDAFTMGLCTACGNKVQRLVRDFVER